MIYQSTRNQKLTVSPAQAVLQGLAPDGGLFVPQGLEEINFDWRGVLKKDTLAMAAQILHALLPDFEDMDALVRQAYAGKFETEDLTPLRQVGEDYVLELFRGPTSAFKDVALSMLPQLMTAARRQTGQSETILILTATSGDTGKAALEGFRDVPGIRIVVFYPEQGVSVVQKAQMVTQQGGNVRVCAVRGNFDDAQTGVKQAFAAVQREGLLEKAGVRLSSANSINIGRLAPQVVYYFKAYADLVRMGRIREGEPVDFVVPTGNFGDILAGHYAKRMGLPVGMLVCASNANDVLTQFIRTGVYDRRRPFHKTASPSMDILVSSNLERLLFELSGEDDGRTAAYMAQLEKDGRYAITEQMLCALQAEFWAGCCGEEETSQTIRSVWKENGYLCDTHTAVAWNVAQQYKQARGGDAPVVVLSTASPYKFPQAVLDAIGGACGGDAFAAMDALARCTGVPVPKNLAGLQQREVLHRQVIDREEILSYVLQEAGKEEPVCGGSL